MGKHAEDVLSPEHKYLLSGSSTRSKPVVPQQLPVSFSHSCCDEFLALNDVCFHLRVILTAVRITAASNKHRKQ